MGERIRGFGSKKFGFYLPVGLEQGCRYEQLLQLVKIYLRTSH